MQVCVLIYTTFFSCWGREVQGEGAVGVWREYFKKILASDRIVGVTVQLVYFEAVAKRTLGSNNLFGGEREFVFCAFTLKVNNQKTMPSKLPKVYA
jgi:hypothetical protein